MSGDDNLRERLIHLRAEKLADILVELRGESDKVGDMIKRTTATPSENKKRFKAKLAGLKRARRFIDWRGASDFADELEQMLADLEAGVDDPKTGVEMVAAFFEADDPIFNRCDDSDGSVGDVFRGTACALFVHYASRCADKAWLVDKLMELYAEDEYGVRDVLLAAAHRFLPQESLRDLADRLWQRSQMERPDTYESRHWLLVLESVARQLKDAALYEKAQRAARPELSTSAQIDIAQVYLEAGDPQTALTWLERVQGETFRSSDRDDLLLAVYRELGDKDKAAVVAWRIFRSYRSDDTLKTLLFVIGDSERERVIADELPVILSEKELSYSDVEFLIASGRIDEAETYLLSHADEFEGDYYTRLLPLAESMEKNRRWLAASLIYRALLNSILARAVSKYYHHGVKYLKKLDSLAGKVSDWKQFENHASYKSELSQIHGRKTSFWARYAGE
ncbi:MAG: DUF6880 family protein [Armatimonadota bacterium]